MQLSICAYYVKIVLKGGRDFSCNFTFRQLLFHSCLGLERYEIRYSAH